MGHSIKHWFKKVHLSAYLLKHWFTYVHRLVVHVCSRTLASAGACIRVRLNMFKIAAAKIKTGKSPDEEDYNGPDGIKDYYRSLGNVEKNCRRLTTVV